MQQSCIPRGWPNKKLRKPFIAKTPNSLVSHVLSYNSALEQQLNVNTAFWERRGLPLYLSQCCHCAFEMRSKAGALRNFMQWSMSLWSSSEDWEDEEGIVTNVGKIDIFGVQRGGFFSGSVSHNSWTVMVGKHNSGPSTLQLS